MALIRNVQLEELGRERVEVGAGILTLHEALERTDLERGKTRLEKCHS